MRKHILILFLLIENVIYVFGQYEEVRKELDRVSIRPLPYTNAPKNPPRKAPVIYTENAIIYPDDSGPFPHSMVDKMELPIFVYTDYECTQKLPISFQSEDDVDGFRFISDKHDCYVLYVHIAGESFNHYRNLLATFDKTGKRIDYIEVGLKWDTWVCLEQFSIDTAMQVVVNKLTPMEKEPVSKYDFKSFTGYRTDTYYQILANGEIIKTKEVVFEPQLYYGPTPEERKEGYCYFISRGDEKVKTITECNERVSSPYP